MRSFEAHRVHGAGAWGQSESDDGPMSDDEGGAGEGDVSEDEDEAETPAEKRLRIGAPPA